MYIGLDVLLKIVYSPFTNFATPRTFMQNLRNFETIYHIAETYNSMGMIRLKESTCMKKFVYFSRYLNQKKKKTS